MQENQKYGDSECKTAVGLYSFCAGREPVVVVILGLHVSFFYFFNQEDDHFQKRRPEKDNTLHDFASGGIQPRVCFVCLSVRSFVCLRDLPL